MPQPDDGLGDSLVQLGGQPGHVGQGVNITRRNPSSVGAYDAPDEGGVLVILDPPPSSVWCQPSLTLDRLPDSPAPAPAAWSAMRGAIRLLLPPRPPEGITAWGLHPIGAEVVEPGVEVKLLLLDALDWQRLRASWVVLVWRGQAKGSCVQPLLDRSGRRNTICIRVKFPINLNPVVLTDPRSCVPPLPSRASDLL